jgi:putative FmdB family regulatory protein
MPLHDFRCHRCNQTFELLIRGSDIPSCPACGNQELEKLVSMPAAPGKTAGIISRARGQAAREGHFSNYAPSERPKNK